MSGAQLLSQLGNMPPYTYYGWVKATGFHKGNIEHFGTISDIQRIFESYIVYDRNNKIITEKDSFRLLVWKASLK